METVAGLLAGHPGIAGGLRVIRFEFPYLARGRERGKRLPPDRQPVLVEHWLRMIDEERRLEPGRSLFIGGKSLGGRIASMVADDEDVDGLVCLGYPFHPPGKPDRLRTGHLVSLRTPALFCQGERDPFGGREEVTGYRLSAAIRFHWLPDGDHGFEPRRKSGFSLEQNLESACSAIAGFISAHSAR